MSKSLNKQRMMLSRAALIAAGLVLVVLPPSFAPDSLGHETLEMMGILAVGACAIGRVYVTAFLGGHKNERLIDYGPFSVCRNPLYALSWLGCTGIALMSNHVSLILAVPLFIAWLYRDLVAREEGFLGETFGESYSQYCARVPRFLPKPALYTAPERVEMAPKLLWNAVRDAALWLLALPAIEIIEALRAFFA